jgi:hypothetical protein
MDGKVQTNYPRKNWSSFMLFNCEHPSTKTLTPEVINSQTGAYLHRMQWAADEEIRGIPGGWNWLEGWSEKPETGTPSAVHFANGGPWFKGTGKMSTMAICGRRSIATIRMEHWPLLKWEPATVLVRFLPPDRPRW